MRAYPSHRYPAAAAPCPDRPLSSLVPTLRDYPWPADGSRLRRRHVPLRRLLLAAIGRGPSPATRVGEPLA